MDQKFEISRGSVTVPKRRRDSREGRRRRGRDAAGDDINNKRIFLLCAAAQPRRREGDFSPRSPHPDSRCAEDSGGGGRGYIVCFSGFSSYPMRRGEEELESRRRRCIDTKRRKVPNQLLGWRWLGGRFCAALSFVYSHGHHVMRCEEGREREREER